MKVQKVKLVVKLKIEDEEHGWARGFSEEILVPCDLRKELEKLYLEALASVPLKVFDRYTSPSQ